MWTVACGTLLLGYTFWGLFPALEDARRYAEKVEGECFIVRIHMIEETEDEENSTTDESPSATPA